jgi:hypothetical protein
MIKRLPILSEGIDLNTAGHRVFTHKARRLELGASTILISPKLKAMKSGQKSFI